VTVPVHDDRRDAVGQSYDTLKACLTNTNGKLDGNSSKLTVAEMQSIVSWVDGGGDRKK